MGWHMKMNKWAYGIPTGASSLSLSFSLFALTLCSSISPNVLFKTRNRWAQARQPKWNVYDEEKKNARIKLNRRSKIESIRFGKWYERCCVYIDNALSLPFSFAVIFLSLTYVLYLLVSKEWWRETEQREVEKKHADQQKVYILWVLREQ